MEGNGFNETLTDIEPCQPDEFELIERKVEIPNRRECKCIYDKKNYRTEYIYNKRNREDDSYYAPYLVYRIGKKLGIEVPETEIRIVLHKDDNIGTYNSTFYESAIIYDEKLGNEILWLIGNNCKFISQEDIYQNFLSQNPEKSQGEYNSFFSQTNN